MIRVGARVRVKPECIDAYLQPWRGRFEEGRLGTVLALLPDGRWKVIWDTKRRPRRQSDWELRHWETDLEVAP